MAGAVSRGEDLMGFSPLRVAVQRRSGGRVEMGVLCVFFERWLEVSAQGGTDAVVEEGLARPLPHS